LNLQADDFLALRAAMKNVLTFASYYEQAVDGDGLGKGKNAELRLGSNHTRQIFCRAFSSSFLLPFCIEKKIMVCTKPHRGEL
jgi:hypothetical protein